MSINEVRQASKLWRSATDVVQTIPPAPPTTFRCFSLKHIRRNREQIPHRKGDRGVGQDRGTGAPRLGAR